MAGRNEVGRAVRSIRRFSRERANVRKMNAFFDAFDKALGENASPKDKEVARLLVDAAKGILVDRKRPDSIDEARFAIDSDLPLAEIHKEFARRTSSAKKAKPKTAKRARKAKTVSEDADEAEAATA